MNKIYKKLAGILFGTGWMLWRGLLTLMAAGVLYFYPDVARKIFAGVIWTVLAAVLAAGSVVAAKSKSPFPAWLGLGVPAAAAIMYLAFARINLVGVWGVALWAILAAIALGWAGCSREAHWQARLAAVAGAILAALAAVLFLRRPNPDFIASSALFALFFAALGVLLIAAHPIKEKRK